MAGGSAILDQAIVKDLLNDIKLAFPRFSLPSGQRDRDRLVFLWQRALGNGAYPPHVFQEALAVYMRDSRSDGNPPMAGDILAACKKVIEEIESDPDRRGKLEAWRRQRRDERDRQLSASRAKN